MGNDIGAALAIASPVTPTAPDVKSADLSAQQQQAENLSNTLSHPSPMAPPTAPSKYDSGSPTDSRHPEQAGSGSFRDKLQASLQQAKAGADSAMMSQPGSWAKVMVGSAMDALAGGPFDPNAPQKGPSLNDAAPDKAVSAGPGSHGYTADRQVQPKEAPQPVQHFGQHFMDSLGDMAGPGGAADMAARGAIRVREEMKDRQMMATSNAEMLHQQALTHKLGDESMKENIADGLQQRDAMISPPPNGGKAGTEDAKDKTSDELEQMIKTGQFHPTVQTAFATGRREIGKDKSGMPLYQTTYSVVTPPPEMYITKDIAKHLNESTGSDFYVGDDTAKQQRLPGVQVNGMIQRANNAKTAMQAIQKSQAANDIEIRKDRINKDVDSMAQNPVVQEALQASQTGPNDPFAIVKGFNYIMSHKALREDPRLPKDFAEVYARGMGGDETGANFKEMTAKYEAAATKTGQDAVGALGKLEANPKELDGKGATQAFGAALQPIADHPEKFLPAGTPQADVDKLRQRAVDQLAIIASVQKADHDSEVKLAGDKKSAEEEASMPFDVSAENVKSVLNYQTDPKDMEGLRGGLRGKFYALVTKAAREQGIDWSEAKYKERYQTTQDFRPTGYGGKQIISLNTFGGHVQNALDLIPALNNKFSPTWNKHMNDIEQGFGEDQRLRMNVALTNVKDEYLNFIKNMRAPTDDEIKRAEVLVSGDSSPKAIWGVMAQMAETLGVRGGQLQRIYTKEMEKPYTEMLDPDVDKTMQRLGVDTRKMRGVPADTPQAEPWSNKATSSATSPAAGTGKHQRPTGSFGSVPDDKGVWHFINKDGTKDFGVDPYKGEGY